MSEADEEARLAELVAEARACRHCAAMLPLGPRPVLRARCSARLLIIGQAPGTKVHDSGIPWDDASGRRLRQWLEMTPERFYDEAQVAIIPAGLCYPGRDAKGGDLPPRPECAPLWHPRLLPLLTGVRLTLLVGAYAQRLALGKAAAGGVTATVARWRDFLPDYLPLPHPSWRTMAWERRHPWFAAELLPALRRLLSES
jgi:uracil-DNA glycosylase